MHVTRSVFKKPDLKLSGRIIIAAALFLGLTKAATPAGFYNLGAFWRVSQATHLGWNQVEAVGASTPVSQSGLTATTAFSTIGWYPMIAPGPSGTVGTISSYNIYRATTSGGENFASPLATGIATTTYTDTTVAANTAYYYVVRPVVGGTEYSTPQPFSEIEVYSPPNNMSLVHRWMANQRACEIMYKVMNGIASFGFEPNANTDPYNNYRCPYTGPGNTGGYFDLGMSILVDTYEPGCNWTPAAACTASGCINTGAVAPAGGTGVANNVYFLRGNQVCYLNTGGAWLATSALTTNAERLLIQSNSPGLPPLTNISQSTASKMCHAQTVAGLAGTKQLLSHKMAIIANSWTIAQQTAIGNAGGQLENDSTANLPTSGYCNCNNPNGLTYDNNVIPANLETTPCSLASGCEMVRTGSTSTKNCVSQFGIQDMVGNAEEWLSDQLATCSAATDSCTGQSSALDPANTDLNGFVFNGTEGPGGTATGAITDFGFAVDAALNVGHFLSTLGIPIVNGASATLDYGTYVGGAGFTYSHFWLDTGNPNGAPARGATNGSNYSSGSWGGQWAYSFYNSPANTYAQVGYRCYIATTP